MQTDTANHTTTTTGRWLTTVEMAKRLRIHSHTLSRWARNRVVSCLVTSDGYRFDPEVVEQELLQPARGTRAG